MFSLERGDTGGTALFGSFYLRRAFRIYPLSMACVLSIYLVHCPPGYRFYDPAWTRLDLITNLSLTQNLFFTARDMLNVLWSLPIEVQMYVFLPFLFVLFRTRSAGPAFLLWALSIPLAIFQARNFSRLNVLSYAPCFLPGILSWRLHTSKQLRLPGSLWPVCIAVISLIWMDANRQYHWYFRWVFCLVLGLTIPFFREIPYQRLRAIAKTIATYSYGVYLSHTPIMILCFLVVKNPWVKWPLFLALAVLTPYLMYHLIERPGIIAGQAFVRRIFRPDVLRLQPKTRANQRNRVGGVATTRLARPAAE
jgi:peptidoglycan/LPS O-acetylase OafA/YrhL